LQSIDDRYTLTPAPCPGLAPAIGLARGLDPYPAPGPRAGLALEPEWWMKLSELLPLLLLLLLKLLLELLLRVLLFVLVLLLLAVLLKLLPDSDCERVPLLPLPLPLTPTAQPTALPTAPPTPTRMFGILLVATTPRLEAGRAAGGGIAVRCKAHSLVTLGCAGGSKTGA
jgi:hypothetical protein